MIKISRQLVENFAAGDLKSAGILFEQLRRPLFAFLYRLSCDRCIAEDLLQETLLTLHSRIETFNLECEFMPWAWTIARNKFLEFKRSQSKVVRLLPQLAVKCRQLSDSFSNEIQFGTDLKNCLDTLSEPTREAFVLKHFQGLTFQEIADLQQIPLPTAKSRVLYSLKKVREYFNRGEK
jgi:RNA polymerase sigma-70 factor (ECF subfamily)